MRNWVSFDAQRGKMVVRNLNAEYEEFVGTILESRVVRVMKDEDGNVFCASSDRAFADTGRPGRECASCPDRDIHCFRRWWIAWQEVESGLLFAHTLSQTGSLNFNRYANAFLAEGLLPSQILTRLFVEEALRRNSHTLYRRIQFERVRFFGTIPETFGTGICRPCAPWQRAPADSAGCSGAVGEGRNHGCVWMGLPCRWRLLPLAGHPPLDPAAGAGLCLALVRQH